MHIRHIVLFHATEFIAWLSALQRGTARWGTSGGGPMAAHWLVLGCMLTIWAPAAAGEEIEYQYQSEGIAVPSATADEPLVAAFGEASVRAAVRYLDDGAHAWVREKSCVACHSTGVYLVERSPLTSVLGPPSEEVRNDFAASIPTAAGKPILRNGGKYYSASIQSVWRSSGLAAWDRFVTGSLSAETDRSLRHTLQCFDDAGFIMTFPQVEIPYITTDFELTVQAARAMVTAPGWLDMLTDDESLQTVARMRTFLSEHQPVSDYERALQLQLAHLMPDLISAEQQAEAIAMLWRQQQPDGGWSTRRMSDLMKWHVSMDPKVVQMIEAEPDAADPGSDAYMTAFAIVLLRESDVPANDVRIRKGIDWLKARQRVSGRWWMKSLFRDTRHYSTYISTAQVLRALALCNELPVLAPTSAGAGGPLNDRSDNDPAGQLVSAHSAPELCTGHDAASDVLQVGLSEMDITPPNGFPMAGYYHERLAEGTLDPLKARAVVIRDGDTACALVVCDLIGIATDLSREVRQRASQKTGIPAEHIVLSGTHTHTAPDYMKALWLWIGEEPQDELRSQYVASLVERLSDVIVAASESVQPTVLESGSALQQHPVAFNRRFVMRDGSVKTWQSFRSPDVVRAAGPTDPEIGIVAMRSEAGQLRGVLSNFALHLDTVGGSSWSADYPFYIERTLKSALGGDVMSIFATGCCGDINHVNPHTTERNSAGVIGGEVGSTIVAALPMLERMDQPRLAVQSRTVQLPLRDATAEDVSRSIEVLQAAARKDKVDFLDHVAAYRNLILDQLRHPAPHAVTHDHITWGLSRSLAGVGETLPVDVTVIAIGSDVAIVCLPGEVFVELGLAIKQASPWRTTIVIELSNAVETVYIPHRAAYAGGSYEVTNSALRPGAGELLVETAVTLLRETASRMQSSESAK